MASVIDPPSDFIDAILLAAPRRFAMPALPAEAAAAQALGPPAALAWVMEQVRRAVADGVAPAAACEAVFVRALKALVGAALQHDAGDAAFQARMLQARSASVAAHVRLSAGAATDRRRVGTAVNAWAHPVKLRAHAVDLRDALRPLHDAMQAGAWQQLAQSLDAPAVPAVLRRDACLREAIARLVQAEHLLHDDDVRRFEALRARQTPPGAVNAAARGQAAEHAAALACHAMATAVNDLLPPGAPRLHVATRLLLPAGFPGDPARSKNEWDIALVGDAGSGPSRLHLLAEVKASPEAATSDLPKLLRGLRRLAQADTDAVYALPCNEGTVRLQGRSLREFAPGEHTLPARVLYLSTADTSASPPWLDAAARGLLLSQPQVLAYALQRAADPDAPNEAPLRALWAALPHDPRLRALLHHHDTARHVRAAMLHPDDLLAAVQRLSASPSQPSGISPSPPPPPPPSTPAPRS